MRSPKKRLRGTPSSCFESLNSFFTVVGLVRRQRLTHVLKEVLLGEGSWGGVFIQRRSFHILRNR